MYSFYEYKATYYVDGERVERGVTYAKDFGEAMTNIEEYYGEDLICVTLYGLEHNSVYVLEGPSAEKFFED